MKGILIVGSCSSGGIACLKYVRVKVGKSLESSTPIFNGSLLSCALAVVHFAPHFGWSLIPFSANYHGYEGLLITILVPVHTAQ